VTYHTPWFWLNQWVQCSYLKVLALFETVVPNIVLERKLWNFNELIPFLHYHPHELTSVYPLELTPLICLESTHTHTHTHTAEDIWIFLLLKALTLYTLSPYLSLVFMLLTSTYCLSWANSLLMSPLFPLATRPGGLLAVIPRLAILSSSSLCIKSYPLLNSVALPGKFVSLHSLCWPLLSLSSKALGLFS